MKLNFVLAQLEKFKIRLLSDTEDEAGWRTLIVGCAAPSPPFAVGRFLFYTLVLEPGQDTVPLEEREALRRRLWHGTTDIFGDDETNRTELEKEDISEMLALLRHPRKEE
jgi:hypothetical protein